MKTTKSMGVVLSVLSLAGCAQTEVAVEETSGSEDAIIAGSALVTNRFSVAIYHKVAGAWFPRPCTGMLFATKGTLAYVLTAYHCVNEGTAADLRLTTALAPGKIGATPPSNFVTAQQIWVPIGASPDVRATDIAIIVAPNNADFRVGLQPLTTATDVPAFYFGASSGLSGRSLTGFGYGRFTACTAANDSPSVPGVDCDIEDANSGAGVLRTGTGYLVYNFGPSVYSYDNNGGGGAHLYHGDSGGPSLFRYTYTVPARGPDDPDLTWRMFAGVHGTADTSTGTDCSSPAVPSLVQDMLGHMYVSNVYAPGGFLRRTANTVGATVQASTNDGGQTKWWIYSPPTQQLLWESLCVQGNASGAAVTMANCNNNDTKQKWTHTPDLQLRNTSTGLCLNWTSTSATSAPCAVRAEQGWVFRAQAETL
jgi:hypothetical protein